MIFSRRGRGLCERGRRSRDIHPNKNQCKNHSHSPHSVLREPRSTFEHTGRFVKGRHPRLRRGGPACPPSPPVIPRSLRRGTCFSAAARVARVPRFRDQTRGISSWRFVILPARTVHFRRSAVRCGGLRPPRPASIPHRRTVLRPAGGVFTERVRWVYVVGLLYEPILVVPTQKLLLEIPVPQ